MSRQNFIGESATINEPEIPTESKNLNDFLVSEEIENSGEISDEATICSESEEQTDLSQTEETFEVSSKIYFDSNDVMIEVNEDKPGGQSHHQFEDVELHERIPTNNDLYEEKTENDSKASDQPEEPNQDLEVQPEDPIQVFEVQSEKSQEIGNQDRPDVEERVQDEKNKLEKSQSENDWVDDEVKSGNEDGLENNNLQDQTADPDKDDEKVDDEETFGISPEDDDRKKPGNVERDFETQRETVEETFATPVIALEDVDPNHDSKVDSLNEIQEEDQVDQNANNFANFEEEKDVFKHQENKDDLKSTDEISNDDSLNLEFQKET